MRSGTAPVCCRLSPWDCLPAPSGPGHAQIFRKHEMYSIVGIGDEPRLAGESLAGEHGDGVLGAGDCAGVSDPPASTTRRASPGGSPDQGPLNAGLLAPPPHRHLST